MTGSDMRKFYSARVEHERKEGDEAVLPNVRDRSRRSEAAWSQLANRAERGEKTRSEEAKRVAERRAEEAAKSVPSSKHPESGSSYQ